MQGHVLVFRPSTWSGLIQSEFGEAYRFSLPSGGPPFQAGDRVSFRPADAGHGLRRATDVSLLFAWSDWTEPAETGSLTDLCKALQIEAVAG